MAGRPPTKLSLAASDYERLRALFQSGRSRERMRAGIVLLRAEGLSQTETAGKCRCSVSCVARWSRRFLERGVEGLLNSKSPEEGPSAVEETDEIEEGAEKGSDNVATLRSVAREAGVSLATVSRVLNNLPKVSERVRSDVLEAMERLGYRRDPELKKLMIHLRRNYRNRFRGSICSLQAESWEQYTTSGYFCSLVEGARQKAEDLGFIWEVYSLEAFLERPNAALNRLYNRGVQGILFTPVPLELAPRFQATFEAYDWGRFSVVVATHSLLMNMFRRVVPNHFQNVNKICDSLVELGYTRLGMVISQSLDAATQYQYSAAFVAFHIRRGWPMIPVFRFGEGIREAEVMLRSDAVRRWFKNEKPDAIVINGGGMIEPLAKNLELKLPGPVAIAATAFLTRSAAGIDQVPERVGAIAVEQLGNMIIHSEKGPAVFPTVTQVDGEWCPGQTAPRKVR